MKIMSHETRQLIIKKQIKLKKVLQPRKKKKGRKEEEENNECASQERRKAVKAKTIKTVNMTNGKLVALMRLKNKASKANGEWKRECVIICE